VLLIYGALVVFRNLAFYRYVPGNRLKDLGFDIFPEMPAAGVPHTDDPIIIMLVLVGFVLLGALLGPDKTRKVRQSITSSKLVRYCQPESDSDFIVAGIMESHQTDEHPYLANIIRRMSCAYSIGHILRAMTYLATSLPGSAEHCLPGAESNPPKSISECFYRMSSVNGTCGDLIFSGHMLYMWLALCCIQKYGAKCWGIVQHGRFHLSLLFLGFVLLVIQGINVVMSRHHYSVDVIVASYTTPMLFHFYNTVIQPNEYQVDFEAVEKEIAEYRTCSPWKKLLINLRILALLALFVFLLMIVIHGNFKWIS